MCGEGDPSWRKALIVKTVPLVTLRERRWWWPCLGDLASLSLCLSEALVANARRDQAKRLGVTLVLVFTSDRGRREGLVVLTEPR